MSGIPGTAATPLPAPRAGGLGRAYHYVMQGCGMIAGAVIGAMSVMIVLNVAARNVQLGSISWAMEGSEYAMAWATFLGAPWVLYQAGHVRIDLLLNGLPPAAARRLDALVNALGAAICGVLLYFMSAAGAEDYGRQAMVFKAFTFPQWWTFAIPVVCFALLTIEFLRRLWRDLVPDHDARWSGN